jgi:DNA-binding transcriptional LysR family regulator
MQADDRLFGIYPVPPVELHAVCHPGFQLRRGSAVDIDSVTAHPLLLLDSGFVMRKTFDTACRLSRLKPNVLFESGVPHNLLAFAEAGLGVATRTKRLRRCRGGPYSRSQRGTLSVFGCMGPRRSIRSRFLGACDPIEKGIQCDGNDRGQKDPRF